MKLVFALALVIIGVQCNLAVLEQIKNININPTFAKQFADLLQLQMEVDNFTPLVEKVKAILDGLQSEQAVDDLEQTKLINELTEQIKSLQNSIEVLTRDLQQTNQSVGDLATEVASLTQQISSIRAQLVPLTKRLTVLAEQRTSESSDYEAKLKRRQRLLNAVGVLLQKLTALALNESGSFLEVDRETVTYAVKSELGEKHPITLMVQMTAKFDLETLTKVINKLEQIQNGIQNDIDRDERAENDAVLTSQTAQFAITEVVNRLTTDVNRAESRNRVKSDDYTFAQQRSLELKQELSNSQELLSSTQDKLEKTASSYQVRRNDRISQIGVIQEAYDLLQANADSLKAQ